MNIKEIKEKAQEEVNEERTSKAVKLLKQKYREVANAKQILKNLESEVQDLENSIEDGTAFDD